MCSFTRKDAFVGSHFNLRAGGTNFGIIRSEIEHDMEKLFGNFGSTHGRGLIEIISSHSAQQFKTK